MDTVDARQLLRKADFEEDQIETLLEVFALLGHEHEANEINTGENEEGEPMTLDESLDALDEAIEELEG